MRNPGNQLVGAAKSINIAANATFPPFVSTWFAAVFPLPRPRPLVAPRTRLPLPLPLADASPAAPPDGGGGGGPSGEADASAATFATRNGFVFFLFVPLSLASSNTVSTRRYHSSSIATLIVSTSGGRSHL